MRSFRPRVLALLLFLLTAASGCTRQPYDLAEPAVFNQGRFIFRRVLPSDVLLAVSAAGNS